MPAKIKEPNPPALRKISFGAISKKKETTKSNHPVVPDGNGQLAAIASRILERHSQMEALSGALDVDKAEIKTLVTPFFFQNASGKIDIPTGVLVECETAQVLISFPNRYGKLESEEPLHPILGARTGEYFRQAFSLEIDGDKLPAEKAEDLLGELQELFGKYNALDALNVKESIRPVPDFHTVRHTALTPAQNLAIDQVCPVIAMVKVKAAK